MSGTGRRARRWDGGVVEISKDNGMTWTDVGDKMSMTGYGGQLSGDNPALGNLAYDFDFTRKPSRPAPLPVHPRTTLTH